MDHERYDNISQFDQTEKAILIITDRREDPITPLITPWTYQSMLHEHIGLNLNRLQLKHKK